MRSERNDEVLGRNLVKWGLEDTENLIPWLDHELRTHLRPPFSGTKPIFLLYLLVLHRD